MIVNSVRAYLGEIMHIEARILRDKFDLDLFTKYTGPDDPIKWYNEIFKKFLALEEVQEKFRSEGGYGPPRDVRESEDGEVILFTTPKGVKIEVLLDWNGTAIYENEQERFEEYINQLYSLCWNMEWIEEIQEMVDIESTKNKFLKIKQNRAISKSVRHEVFKRDGYRCLECGATNKESVLHIDHIVPVSLGGSKKLDNLQTLCEKCNIAKGNATWKGGCE